MNLCTEMVADLFLLFLKVWHTVLASEFQIGFLVKIHLLESSKL